MRDGDNLDAASDLPIDDAVGELSQNVPPSACFKPRPEAWIFSDQRQASLELPEKGLRGT